MWSNEDIGWSSKFVSVGAPLQASFKMLSPPGQPEATMMTRMQCFLSSLSSTVPDLKTFGWSSGAILLHYPLPGAGQAVLVRMRGVVIFTAEFLERLPLGLGNQQGRETPEKHEQRVNLEDVVEPWVSIGAGSATSSERSNSTLA